MTPRRRRDPREPASCSAACAWRRRSCRPTSGGCASRSRDVLDAGARVIHVDVMDGHFVPPITIGPLVVAGSGRPGPRGRRDARRAPDDRAARAPRRRVRASAGADSITFHAEATPHVAYAAEPDPRRRRLASAWRSTRATPPEALRELAGAIDLALCMTVNPGWGGQRVHRALAGEDPARARDRRRRRRGRRSTAASTPTPPRRAAQAGANVFVAGSAIFGADDPPRPTRRSPRSIERRELSPRLQGGRRRAAASRREPCR